MRQKIQKKVIAKRYVDIFMRRVEKGIGAMSKVKSGRQSNLELLRILAMCMIICCHFVTYNNFGPTNMFSDKTLALSMLRLGGKLGVVLFVMITGYFMLNKTFKWQRIIDLSRQTVYFSVLVAVLAYAFAGTKPDLLGVFRMMFPLIMENYWFPTDFAVILILSPALNKLVNTVDKKTMTLGLAGLIVLIGFPLIVPDMKNAIIGLILAYVLGAYIQKYDLKISSIKLLLLLVLVGVVTTAVTGLLLTASHSSAFISGFRLFFVTGFNASAYASAVLIFLLFRQWNFGNIKIINAIASTTFGVYLFHDSRAFRMYMWHDIINPAQWHGPKLVVGLFLTVIGIFVVGMFLDLLRQYVELLVKRIIDRIHLKQKQIDITEIV